MSAPFKAYLKLLQEVGALLEQLAALAEQKAAAVRQDDLLALDEVLKQEQALGLNLRGLEIRRAKLVAELGLEGTTLSALPSKCPPELERETRQTVSDLQNSYTVYQGCAGMARTTLELNLHQIEKLVTTAGGDPKDLGAGYDSPGAEPPRRMKTDFRA